MNLFIQKTTKVSHFWNVLDASGKPLLGISKKRNLISQIMVTPALSFNYRQNKLVFKDVLLRGDVPIYYNQKYRVIKIKLDVGMPCWVSHTAINMYFFLAYIKHLLAGYGAAKPKTTHSLLHF